MTHTFSSPPEQPSDPAARLAAERTSTAARVAALAAQIAALAEQQALTTHDDEHDPEGVTIGFERARVLGLLAGARSDLDAIERAARRLAAGTYGRRADPRRATRPEGRSCCVFVVMAPGSQQDL